MQSNVDISASPASGNLAITGVMTLESPNVGVAAYNASTIGQSGISGEQVYSTHFFGAHTSNSHASSIDNTGMNQSQSHTEGVNGVYGYSNTQSQTIGANGVTSSGDVEVTVMGHTLSSNGGIGVGADGVSYSGEVGCFGQNGGCACTNCGLNECVQSLSNCLGGAFSASNNLSGCCSVLNQVLNGVSGAAEGLCQVLECCLSVIPD